MITKGEEYILDDEERVKVVEFEREIKAIDSNGVADEDWWVVYERKELLKDDVTLGDMSSGKRRQRLRLTEFEQKSVINN